MEKETNPPGYRKHRWLANLLLLLFLRPGVQPQESRKIDRVLKIKSNPFSIDKEASTEEIFASAEDILNNSHEVEGDNSSEH